MSLSLPNLLSVQLIDINVKDVKENRLQIGEKVKFIILWLIFLVVGFR